MWAMEVGLMLSGGNCSWLGWQFGPPAKVLYIQAEIMDGLLSDRLQWIIRTAPPQLDIGRASENFIIREICSGQPNLFSDQGRTELEDLIELHKPQILILDPLATLCPGMEENAAESMGEQLAYFSGVNIRFNLATILIHHHGKSGISRGSSVFEAWPESDITASFVSPEDHTVARIDMRLRCAYNPGPVYWRMPDPDNPWFEAMDADWAPEKAGRKAKAEVLHVVLALKAAGTPIGFERLAETVQDICSCARRTAANVIKSARESGKVVYQNGCYVLP